MNGDLQKLIEAVEAKAKAEEHNSNVLEDIRECLKELRDAQRINQRMSIAIGSTLNTLTLYLGAAAADDEDRTRELLARAQEQSANLTVNLSADDMSIDNVAGGDIRGQ